MSDVTVRVRNVTTALYRRYRPESFADVIGQEHVTEPLMQALRTGRVNHAYLFSGPRGCGKTTSARILARCLNCEQGPTDIPCGVCDSCVALARGGSGSVDVIEIDAASHGGVDDARDLRERASYGPASSRFKIYIIDEAHMVTPQGFNALLKIVEEPPEHVKFVFATTEPDKVIGTIRSRTHHYPFRLVPPLRLQDYLGELCEAESVAVEPGVLSFVVRAGGGSVRDSLSVLDQLIAGSGEQGLTYESAAALLGFTDGELLDATVDGLAAGSSATVFKQVDKVIESGHDPRRFVEDVLERLRDLIVVAAIPDGASSVLRGVPEDQLERMRQQAAAFGPGALSRAADIVNAGLTEMSGATAPRLQLELICARVLLPGASGESGYAARLDRLERRLDVGGSPTEPQAPPITSPARGQAPAPATARQATSPDAEAQAGAAQVEPQTVGRQQDGPQQDGSQQDRPQRAQPERSGREQRPGQARPGEERPGQERPGQERTAQRPSERPRDEQPQGRPGGQQAPERPAAQRQAPGAAPEGPSREAASAAAPRRPATPGGIDTDAIRRSWPDVLAKVFSIKRVTWTFLSEHAQVLDYDGQRLLLGISTIGLANTFRKGQHAELVRQALIEVLGVDAVVEGIPTPESGGARAPASSSSAPTAPSPAPEPPPHQGRSAGGASSPDREGLRVMAAASPAPDDLGPEPDDDWSAPSAPPPEWATEASPAPPDAGSARAGRARRTVDDRAAPPDPPAMHPHGAAPPAAAQAQVQAQDQAQPEPEPEREPAPTRTASPMERARQAVAREAGARRAASPVAADDSSVSADDEDIEDAGAMGVPVIERVLGGTVMGELDQ
jgi:DNA polymerase-3 subunit gamma/tau